ncbi:MAG: hypothetical protein HY329_19905 [Chloroflexi bacterium]|nr:hypothetical protein [Chloroflexota bacterium]
MSHSRERAHGAGFALWFGLLGGHVAWTTHLLAGYALVSIACDLQLPGWEIGFHLLTVAMAGVTIAAGIVAFSGWRQAWRSGPVSVDSSNGPQNFSALAGVLLSGLFLFLILLEGMVVSSVPACQ